MCWLKKKTSVTESHYGYCLYISPWNENLYFSSSKGEANTGIHYLDSLSKNTHFKTIFSFYLKQVLLHLKLLEILEIYVFWFKTKAQFWRLIYSTSKSVLLTLSERLDCSVFTNNACLIYSFSSQRILLPISTDYKHSMFRNYRC